MDTPLFQHVFNRNNSRAHRKKKKSPGVNIFGKKQSIEIDNCISKLSTTLFRIETHLHDLHIK